MDLNCFTSVMSMEGSVTDQDWHHSANAEGHLCACGPYIVSPGKSDEILHSLGYYESCLSYIANGPAERLEAPVRNGMLVLCHLKHTLLPPSTT
jgi:hypothetical protein